MQQDAMTMDQQDNFEDPSSLTMTSCAVSPSMKTSESSTLIAAEIVRSDDYHCLQNSSTSFGGHVLHSILEDEKYVANQQGDDKSAATSFVGVTLTKSWESIVTALHSPISCGGDYKPIENLESAGNDHDEPHLDASEHLRRIYTNMVDEIKNSSTYSVCKDLVLGPPAQAPVVHQQALYQTRWRQKSFTSATSTTDHDKDSASLSTWETDDEKSEQRLGSSPAGVMILPFPRMPCRPVAIPVSMKRNDDGVREDVFGAKVVLTRSPRRRTEDGHIAVFVKDLYQN